MDNAVALVQTYLRLNGFFTVTEYQVQHPVPGRAGAYETATDLDILAVRLPWAAESVRGQAVGQPGHAEVILAEDPLLDLAPNRIDLIIGEVKEGASQLNRRLRTPEVLHAALRRAACCSPKHFDMVVADLAARGHAGAHHRVHPGPVAHVRAHLAERGVPGSRARSAETVW